MSPTHTSQIPAIRNGDHVVAEDGTYSNLKRTNHNPSRGENSDNISSLLRETSIIPTHQSHTSNYAPSIQSSNVFHGAHTTQIIPDPTEYNETRVQASERDEQPQMKASNHRLKLPSLHLHLHRNTVESERQHVDDLQRGRDAALSAECDRIAKQRIDPTRGSIRGLFGRGRHRDAWLIGCDTDATDFGSKVEGKIDAGRNVLSSSGTGRDKLVGTITGREKLAREQEMNISNLLAAKDCCTRRRSRSSGGESPIVGRSVTGAGSLDEPEASRSGRVINVALVLCSGSLFLLIFSVSYYLVSTRKGGKKVQASLSISSGAGGKCMHTI